MNMLPLPSLFEMRIFFIGARVVGYRCLKALLEAGYNIIGLLTLDEMKMEETTAFHPFDDLIEQYHLMNTRKFVDLNSKNQTDWISRLSPHLGIVVGVSQLVPHEILRIPPFGFIGMHPTLLPEGRGRAPIPWALIKGLEKTGVTLFWCESSADAGDIIAQKEVHIYYEDVSATLGKRTDDVAIQLIIENLPKIADDTVERRPQDERLATFWPLRRPADGIINWHNTRRELYNWIRGLTHPYPGAFTYLRGRKVFVFGGRESYDKHVGVPGEVLAVLPEGVLVATGKGNILLTRIQWEDSLEQDAVEAGLKPGDRLGHWECRG